eukprot:TRINITY_DN1862_c1_g2_i18.p1 TRINITY_DN1862_c1_g2~~TRINITY_DN1862_c1_g2_i18.p1  ORF type:complete len:426 (+),score=-83.43 TRINITY_DN1862_c1_g2_i18:1504-2781(+)
MQCDQALQGSQSTFVFGRTASSRPKPILWDPSCLSHCISSRLHTDTELSARAQPTDNCVTTGDRSRPKRACTRSAPHSRLTHHKPSVWHTAVSLAHSRQSGTQPSSRHTQPSHTAVKPSAWHPAVTLARSGSSVIQPAMPYLPARTAVTPSPLPRVGTQPSVAHTAHSRTLHHRHTTALRITPAHNRALPYSGIQRYDTPVRRLPTTPHTCGPLAHLAGLLAGRFSGPGHGPVACHTHIHTHPHAWSRTHTRAHLCDTHTQPNIPYTPTPPHTSHLRALQLARTTARATPRNHKHAHTCVRAPYTPAHTQTARPHATSALPTTIHSHSTHTRILTNRDTTRVDAHVPTHTHTRTTYRPTRNTRPHTQSNTHARTRTAYRPTRTTAATHSNTHAHPHHLSFYAHHRPNTRTPTPPTVLSTQQPHTP